MRGWKERKGVGGQINGDVLVLSIRCGGEGSWGFAVDDGSATPGLFLVLFFFLRSKSLREICEKGKKENIFVQNGFVCV